MKQIKAILNMLLSVKRGKMLNNNGSEWKKWDIHVHTPYSILNNNYGFDLYTDVDNENKFDEFVQKLFLKALKNNVHAIGITDDFVIDGYKSIKERYLGCPEKMEILFPNEEFSASTYISTRCG